MSEEQPEKPTYFGKALAGDFEPAYPVKDAFSDLENVLGDMMSITISTSNLAVFNLENLVLDDDKRNEVLDLIAEHKKSMLALSIRLTNILERAKEAENGSH